MDYVGLLLIFCARIVDVSCGTVRILFLVRGRRALAAMIGFVEVMIYLTALGHIIGGGREMNWIQMVVYCAGFSTGNFIGSLLEEKLMNAYVFLELIMDRTAETKEMIDNIRADGFGATVIYGRGRDGVRTIVKIICRRRDVPVIVAHTHNKGFICISDVKGCSGGQFRFQRK
ncbi:MAG TPA: DUF5698 domain-containing protein [Synergistales bacterium]|jgi:uncharacterized protein YebE (UPF0316 family)|nr:DUF5698 domain-containing protein [Synergistaceae bacterium]HOO87412.1 DUF5698 domain-containing protein [Synergistales bacterium]HRV97389.1 DUF5698 domain-containing protein [Aminobacteriaceae bacterium]MDD3917235.1 DUF5698 domain-containing protein [Synergistaceae bacterium]NLD95967.1 hypothetical protein [Synergistaceae bacterium]